MSDLAIKLRPFSWDDLPTVVDLVNRSEAVDRLDRGTSEQEMRVAWTAPGVEAERRVFLAVVDSEVVGYGRIQLRAGDEQTGFSKFQCFGRVLPAWRGCGVGTNIISECEHRARSRIDEAPTETVYLEAYADKRQQDVADLFVALGLKPVRYFFDMVYDAAEFPPEPVYPRGYGSRSLVAGQDEETMWRVINAAFSDHWGHVTFPLEEWLHWVDSRVFDPDLALLGVGPEDHVVGECLCTIDRERNERRGREEGWIDSLGVLREHRQNGLGRALLLEGMRKLRRRGCTHVLLGVDTENATGALGLYQSVGFHEWRTRVTFCKALRG